MAVTINGSTGISSPGGDTSTSLSTGLLTVTGSTVPANGMYLPSANTLAWTTNSTRNMTLDASGKLGVGSSSPSYKLQVQSPISTGRIAGFYATSVGDVVGDNGFIHIGGGQLGAYYGVEVGFINESASPDAQRSAMVFKTADYTSAPVERARITSSGNLLVGTTSGSYKLVVSAGDQDGMQVSCNGQRVTMRINQSNASYSNIIRTGNSQDKWWDWNVATGASPTLAIYNSNSTGVQITWGATSWSTYSDERLKTDLADIKDAAQKVSTLRAVTGRYKTDEENINRAFLIAQDVLAVLPEAVDASDQNKLSLRYTEVIPLLVAAIKELTAKVTALEAK